MNRLIYHIILRFLGILPGVMTVAFASAQKPVEIFQIDQCDELTLSIQEYPGDRYVWDIYSQPVPNFATQEGDMDPEIFFLGGINTGPTVTIDQRLPAGRYFVRIMAWAEANSNCTNNLLIFILDIKERLPVAEINNTNEFCQGDAYQEIRINVVGRGPWDLVYSWDPEGKEILTLEGNVDPVYYLPIPYKSPGRHSLWVMEVRDGCSVNTYEFPQEIEVIIHPKPRTSGIYLKPEDD